MTASQESLVEQYSRLQMSYASLVQEVLYGLKARISETDLKVAATLGRVKTEYSLAEKIRRKRYTKLSSIPDLAGVRVVCLYEHQIDEISEIVCRDFNVLEVQDKNAQLGEDRMGYQGVHFVVKLGASYSGPRYEGLHGLRCEIQVRTVLQDAWALISHHLVYKGEEAVPARLKRDLNNVTSLLEIAQSVFDTVQEKRESYIGEIAATSADPAELLLQPLDFETLTAYSNWKYPDLQTSDYIQTVLLSDLNRSRYPTLRELDSVVERARVAVNKYATEGVDDLFTYSTDFLTKSLGFIDSDFRREHAFGLRTRQAFEKYSDLVDVECE